MLNKFQASSVLSFLMVIVLFLIGSFSIEGFMTIFNIRALLVLSALLILASSGQTIVMLIGGVDLSIPFIIGFTNVAVAQLSSDGMSFGSAMLLVLFLSFLIGCLNGVISSFFKVHPLIITLGVGTMVLSAVQFWTNGYPSGNAPDYINKIVSIGESIGILPFPWLVPIVVVIVLLLNFVERNTILGKKIYALGSNEDASPYVLINRVFVWAICFGISGLLAGLTGILLLGFSGSAFPQVGNPYLFQTIAVAVIGGVSISGGKGSVLATLAGSLVLIEINTLLIGNDLDPSIVQAFLGLLIILIVAVYGREKHLSSEI